MADIDIEFTTFEHACSGNILDTCSTKCSHKHFTGNGYGVIQWSFLIYIR